MGRMLRRAGRSVVPPRTPFRRAYSPFHERRGVLLATRARTQASSVTDAVLDDIGLCRALAWCDGGPILILKQLPPSRRAIVTLLKASGPATIAQLAPRLGLTGEAVRQQLLQLQRDGWIEPGTQPQLPRLRLGRPATTYRLSEAGENLFPKRYDDLVVALLDATDGALGDGAALRVLEHLVELRVRAFAPSVAGRTLEEKTAALTNWYGTGDPWMEGAKDGDDFRLVERNCPFYNAAMRRPILCTLSINALGRTLGVRVDREETFQNGDGRCVFRVHTHEPIDPDHKPLRAD